MSLENLKMAEPTSRKSEHLDSFTQERFTYFKKEEFEVDWEKISESKFGRVYKVKLKLWREKCAVKTFINSSDYRYGYTDTEITLKTANDFHSISLDLALFVSLIER